MFSAFIEGVASRPPLTGRAACNAIAGPYVAARQPTHLGEDFITTIPSLDGYRADIAAERADPRVGLPDPVFGFALQIVPMINVDLLVRDETGRTLLAWRDDQFGTGWHVPGGIIRYRETMQTRIAAVARRELQADVDAEPAPCHIVEIVDEPRGHFISLLFRCWLRQPLTAAQGLIDPGAAPKDGQLAWWGTVPDALYPSHHIYRAWIGRP